jgi:hypothetical protein
MIENLLYKVDELASKVGPITHIIDTVAARVLPKRGGVAACGCWCDCKWLGSDLYCYLRESPQSCCCSCLVGPFPGQACFYCNAFAC